jgi:hypothetical protein
VVVAMAVLVAGAGCAAGAVREARVAPLGAYPGARGIVVEAANPAAGALDAGAVEGARRSLDAAKLGAPPAGGDDAHLTLRLAVVAAQAQAAPQGTAAEVMSAARSFAGLAGTGAGATAGRLELAGWLLAPDRREVGYVRWEHEGAPDALAPVGGEEAARAIARLVPERQREVVARRAADERLMLTPTALTLAPGEIAVSDDELLLARIAAGLGRRVQLDIWGGGVPIPGAGAGGFAGHGLVAAAGGGVLVLGFFDLGLKVKILDETARLPGLAISYDMLDLFGLGGGGVGVVVAGDGAGGGGYGVVAGANAQFNLVTAVVAKHFGPVQLTAGSYFLDNHHYLPQSAAFQGSCAIAATDANGNQAVVGGLLDCGNGTASIGRLPLQVQPFVGSELVLGPHSSLMVESLLERPLESSLVTTGARWLLGWRRPAGPLALDRVRFRLDAGIIWAYQPAHGGAHPDGSHILPFPWLGVGAYFL